MLELVGGLLSRLGVRLGIALAATAAVGLLLLGVRNSGRQAERVDAMTRTLSNARIRRDAEDDVRRHGGDSAARELLDDWGRD